MAVCNPNTVLADAGCFMCLTPGQVELVITQLLCNISGGGGGTGSSCCHSGTGSPEGVVSGDPGHTYVDTSNGFFYVKTSGTGTTTGWLVIVS